MKPNLVKVYTRHGAILIDTAELSVRGNMPQGKCLYIYNLRGNRVVDTAAYQDAAYNRRLNAIVHPANLFASPELARADSERIFADMEKRGTP